MTYIYVVTEGDYDDTTVRTAFDEKADAEKYAELLRNGSEVHQIILHETFPEVITTLILRADIYPNGEAKNTDETVRMADGKDPVKEGSTSLRFERKGDAYMSLWRAEPDTNKPYVQIVSRGTDHEAVRGDFRKRLHDATANPLKVTVDF